jgi:hypothetical protein
MESRPLLTPQQIMERQIRLIDRFLDQSFEKIDRPVAPSLQERTN